MGEIGIIDVEEIIAFPAKWRDHGDSAGPKRNKEMAEYADALIAVWDGRGRGTRNMINTAKEKDLEVYVKRVED